MSDNHKGIRKANEEEAAVLFELPEVQQAADTVAGHFRDADLCAGRAASLKRNAQWKFLEAQNMAQSDGGRMAKVEANELYAQVLTEEAAGETLTAKGERVWAEVATKHKLYVPHGRRLELVCVERPDLVYCMDFDEGEMGMHPKDTCPNGALRHSPNVTMLRRKAQRGKLEMWPGRKET